ncbi:unnamed protein product [Penicillium nalgiovense]|uniref:NACHT domain-containing protein n=1 Tax=Penicillium nalgiovense TaxID=60175 RepID=A0A9W4HZE1_PENNA|nr:unnamed protein product [Penicillium nalgiovense]CAG8032067.1 unnamed protein product [Penicillium nalgiovense]CAG8033285.1 unnamed protein product [Penicillium nalgiovense]CAG8048767.1 unnamed protein product [Penicillium nalgiovense]CAG8049031.1 unnamed protein product [Penicillium nalgiovense]
MAEVVGLVASIAGLVQIAGQITKLSYSYVSDIKSAPKTQKLYLQEVSALTDVLFRVEKAIQEAESTGLKLPLCPSSLNEEALQECRRHLSVLHLDLDKRLRRLVWPFQEKEIKKYIDLLHRYRSVFADFLSTNIMFDHPSHLCNHLESGTNLQQVRCQCYVQEEQIRQHLYSLFPASDNLLRSRPNACPGTGKWFLSSQNVEKWRTGAPSLLWCYGAPGVGKSLLSSMTIGHLSDKRSETTSSVVYVFCQFSSREQQSLTAILQCMIRQVIEQGNERVLLTMKHLFMDPMKQREPAGLAESFATACELKSTYLLVDGLDEVPGADGLLPYLSSFVENGCRVMVTSRDLGHIRKAMSSATKMEICSQFEDLEIYIDSRFKENELPRGAQKLIGKITEKSGNMFLHTKLILDEILNLTTVRHMQKALEKQSTGLDQVYQSTLQRIDMQPVARRELARRFIGWVVFAKRRLKIDEVIHAFAVESDEDYIEEDNFVSPDLLLRSCVGLVVLHDDKTVSMVHATAYSFFGSTVLLPHDVETDIAETCLRYMCLSPFREGPCTSRVQMSRRFHEMLFLDYASRHWARHLKEIEIVEEDLSSLVQFFICNQSLLNAAVQALHFRNELETDLLDSLFGSIPQNQTALHVAAYWNLTGTLRTLVESGLSTSLADTHGWTPLHYSCANSHFSSSEILVRSGADVDATDDQDWTPLFWASFTGSLDIVRLLLSARAKYTKRSKYGWTALHWAISRGQTEVVLELVQHHQTQLSRVTKADIRTLSVDDVRQLNTPENISPMQIAAESKNALIFDLLVAHFEETGSTEEKDFRKFWSRESFKVPVAQCTWRNTIKSQGGYQGRAVQLIAEKEYVQEDPSSYFKNEFIKEDPSTWKSILLLSAIQDADFQAAKLFIELGADVNYISENGSLLNVAAYQRDPRFVQVLLEKGAEGLPTELDESALHTAIDLGNLETTKVILDSGHAQVDSWYYGETPLHAAAGQQDPRFASLLLSKGAQHDLLDRYQQTALAIAVNNGFVETAQAVIEGGADVNQLSWMWIINNGWRNCLTLAISLADGNNKEPGKRDSATEMARMLLSKGADLGFQDEDGKTALHVAAMCHSVECIELLMAAGCNIDTIDRSGWTPIHTMMQSVSPSWDVEEVEEALRLLLRGLSEEAVISLLSQQTCHPNDRASSYSSYKEDEEDIEFYTPLDDALRRKAWSIARLLMGLGAQPPTSPSFRPTLMDAAEDLECQIVESLIGSGVSPGDGSVLELVNSIDDRLFDEPSSLLSSPRRKFILSKIKNSYQHIMAKAGFQNTNLLQEEIAQASQQILTSLVSAGADVNFYDSEANTTPLLLAAEKIPIALVTATLLEFGADCFYSFGNRLDPILTAAVANNTDSLRCLIAHASTSPKTGHWTQHLEYRGQLANKEVFDCVCLALKRAEKLDYKYANDQTLLHIAAGRGNVDLVTSLISHGAHADIPDEDGFFPIHSAAFSLYESDHGERLHWPRYHDTVEHLLPMNMVQHTSDHHPYRSVEARASLQDAEICQEISTIRDEYLNTMLWGALENKNDTMFLHLLKLETDFNSCPTFLGYHPSLLYHASARGMTEAVLFLLECNVDIEKADGCGWRPLHAASEWDQIEVAERLIAAGANVCASTARYHEESYTGSNLGGEEWNGHPLHLAVMGGKIDMVELLLKHGADVNANTGCFKWSDGRIRGPTALHIALDPRAWYPFDKDDGRDDEHRADDHEDYLKIARMLVEKGASVEGVLDHLQVKHVPSFEGFEDVWDKIRGV